MQAKFPVSIPDKVIKANPDFANLLNEISSLIDGEGTTKEVKKELQSSTIYLERAKKNYFERELLLQCTEDLLLDWRLNSDLNGPLPEQQKLVEHGVYAVEAEQYSKLGLLADTSADLFVSHTNLDGDSSDYLVHAIEEQLKQMIDEISAHDTNSGATTDQLKELIAQVDKTSHDLKQDYVQIENTYTTINRMTIEYIKVLKRTSQIVDQMLEQFKLEQQVQKEQITIKWLQYRAQTVLKKLNVIQQQILTNTYTAHSVAGFKQIRGLLEKAIHTSSHELRQIMRQLDAYSAAGLGFDKLVAQYAGLQNQIRDKSWALKELVSTNSSIIASPNSTWDQ
jgi:hypothetical protein